MGQYSVGLACIVIALFAGTAPALAGGDDLRLTYSEMRTKGRPADFYRLEFVADSNVCNDALGLLSEPSAVRPSLRLPYDYAKIHSDFFLRTSASIAWEPRWVVDRTGLPASGVLVGAGVLDTAIVDIFNTGHQLEVYRVESRLGGYQLHLGYTSQPNDDRDRPVERVDGLRTYVIDQPPPDPPGARLFMDPDFVREALATSEDPWSDSYAFFDIIELKDSYYVLLASALFYSGEAKIYLAAFVEHSKRKLICEFTSRYEIVAK